MYAQLMCVFFASEGLQTQIFGRSKKAHNESKVHRSQRCVIARLVRESARPVHY
jgi:hypothetical protein